MSNQASFLLQKVAPLVIREISPHITSKVTPYVTEKIGIPIAKKVGLPIARRIGIPIARKAGNVFISKVGYPFVNKVIFKNNLDGLLQSAGLSALPNTVTGSLKPDNAPPETASPVDVKPKKRRSLKELIPIPRRGKSKSNLKITPKSYPDVKNNAPIPLPAAPKPNPAQTYIPQQRPQSQGNFSENYQHPYPNLNHGGTNLFGKRRNLFPYE